MSKLNIALLLYFALVSLILFLMMGMDKSKARRSKRRISEKCLFTFALIGGALGGTLGMYAFRHKTRHWYFKWGFPFIALLHAALWIFIFIKF